MVPKVMGLTRRVRHCEVMGLARHKVCVVGSRWTTSRSRGHGRHDCDFEEVVQRDNGSQRWSSEDVP